MGEHTFNVINLDGGLDLVSTHYTLQQKTGTARTLTNYEPSLEGGYRRINGFTKFGTAQPSGAAHQILGVYPYADGVVAVVNNAIYFSVDGTSWSQVNRDTYTAGTGTVSVTDGGSGFIDVTGSGTIFLTEYEVGGHIRISGNIRKIASITSDTVMTLDSEIAGGVIAGTAHYYNGTQTLNGSLLTRNSQGQTQFSWLEKDGEYGSLAMTDSTGNNNIAVFKITGSGAGRVYYYDELNADDFSAPLAPRFCTTFANRLIVANRDGETSTIYWSDRFQNLRFDGASAGSAQVESPVLGVYPFKDKLIIFCRNSIHQLVEIETPANTQIKPISYKTGCANGFSIQELGGDLIFLSHDGIRTLTATDQYGDVTFGVISRNIDPLIKDLLDNTDGLTISSTILRYKNQYRLFYTDPNYNDDSQLGVVGTYKMGTSGQLEWQWSRIQSMPVSCIDSTVNAFVAGDEEEKIYHGGYNGYIYQHNIGNDFDGSSITSQIQLHEIDYGDIGTKKTLHYVKLFGDIEGATDDIFMDIQYDFSDDQTMQPPSYNIVGLSGIALYGTATYGTDTYGGEAKFTRRVLVEGSGFSNNFVFSSQGTGAPYSINSIYVDFRVGAKQ